MGLNSDKTSKVFFVLIKRMVVVKYPLSCRIVSYRNLKGYYRILIRLVATVV